MSIPFKISEFEKVPSVEVKRSFFEKSRMEIMQVRVEASSLATRPMAATEMEGVLSI